MSRGVLNAIYEMFSNDNSVILFDSGFDCLDTEEFLKLHYGNCNPMAFLCSCDQGRATCRYHRVGLKRI